MAKRAAKKAVKKAAKKSAKKAVKKPASRAKSAAKAGPDPRLTMRDQAIANLNWTHASMQALMKDWPADKLTWQPTGHENHLLWTLGHLATFYSWAHSLLAGKPLDLPEGFAKKFGYRSTPVRDERAYPSLDEVLRVHDRAYGALITAAERLKAGDVLSPPAADAHGTADTRLDAIHRSAWHEGWHQGQIAALRRALGLSGIM
jgi:hypothetical protein